MVDYQSLEQRKLLATLTVDTLSDTVDLNDGLVSLREAITAANNNASFGDAAAGDPTGDVIRFDAAISGGTIRLNGNQIVIFDDLMIRGGGVTVDADLQSRIFSIDTNERISISNFSFANGGAPTGSAVDHRADGTLQLSNTHFSNNQSSHDGGAIFKSSGTLRVGNSTFLGNASDNSGGAIHIYEGQLNLFQTTFEGNSAKQGGAISSSESTLYATETKFFSNRALRDGGAVRFTSDLTQALFSKVEMVGNRSVLGDGGALYASSEMSAYVLDSTFENNSTGRLQPSVAGGSGGAIRTLGDLIVKDSEISKNMAVRGLGGGVSARGGDVRLMDTTVGRNRAGGGGGGVHVRNADLVVVNTTISGNKIIVVNGSETAIPPIGNSGGGIYFDNDNDERSHKLVVRSSTLQNNNAADSGGAIFTTGGDASIIDSDIEKNTARGENSRDTYGGGIAIRFGNLDILKSTVSGNRILDSSNSESGNTPFGGGISFSGPVLNIGDSDIASNFSVGNGGAMALFSGDVTIFNSNVGSDTLGGNTAGSRSKATNDFFGNGGGIYVLSNRFFPVSLTLIGGSISENTALGSGGGIFSDREIFTFFVGPNSSGQATQITGNQALRTDGGGAFLTDSSSVFRDTIFENNSARGGAAIAVSGGSLRLAKVSNNSNASRRDDDGYQIDDDVDLTQSSATLQKLDLVISEMDATKDLPDV